jgi:ankyrin repeat protein
MLMANKVNSLIDPKKKEVVLQRIKDRKAPFCAEKPAPEASPNPGASLAGDIHAQYFYLIQGAKNGHLADVKKAIEELGADINMQDKNGNTALILAAKNNYPEIVGYLMGKGANLFIRNKADCDAYTLAVNAGNMVIRTFIESAMKVARGE